MREEEKERVGETRDGAKQPFNRRQRQQRRQQNHQARQEASPPAAKKSLSHPLSLAARRTSASENSGLHRGTTVLTNRVGTVRRAVPGAQRSVGATVSANFEANFLATILKPGRPLRAGAPAGSPPVSSCAAVRPPNRRGPTNAARREPHTGRSRTARWSETRRPV